MMHMAITILVIISLLEVVHRKISGLRSLLLSLGMRYWWLIRFGQLMPAGFRLWGGRPLW